MPTGPLGEFLAKRTIDALDTYSGYSRTIWDISTVAGVIEPRTFSSSPCPRPWVKEDNRYDFEKLPGTIEHVDIVHRDWVFSILFDRLRVK